ncbi:MAG: efflux RND transporter periplasmic adaptor subunit [Chloroflexota bacterium]|nr:efflux RND transporter periplasmic adaptor subunit [Chloroflexota bacterium]
MSGLTIHFGRKTAFRVGLGLPAVLLSACQAVAPQASAPQPLINDRPAVSVAGVVATPSASASQVATFTIKRDTLGQSLGLTGKVIPGRSAQLTLRGTGTVTAVNVRSGETVKQGDILAEFTLDDESLQTARAQATLADLAYQTELAKLDDLRSGTNKDSIQQLRVTIQKDQADIQKLELDKSAVQATNDRSDRELASAKALADKRVALAQVVLQTAQDGLTTAQQNLKQAQDDAQANQQRAQADQEQASADAASAAAAASAAVRAGQRQLDLANAALEQANGEPAASRAAQALETQQLKVDQDKEALNDAQAAIDAAGNQSSSIDHTARQIAAEVASAKANAHAAARALAADSLELKHQQTSLAGAKLSDTAGVKNATFAVEAAKEQLASLKLAEQTAQQKADRLAKQAASKTAVSAPPQATQLSVPAAQAALKQAESTVQTAKIGVQDAQAEQTAAAAAVTAPAQFADHSIDAAQAQLDADQARLRTLQNGSSGNEIAREQIRVNLLRDQSITATAAAQPVVSLKAPFDANVAEVSINPGQTVESGAGAPVANSAATGPQTPAIRLAAAGTNSIVADVSESDVAQLDRGQKMDVSFPGLPGQSTTGTIADIASTGTINKDNQVTYPVRIDLANPPPSLKLGMTAQASLSVAQATDVLVAPRRAIRTVAGQTLMDKLGPDGDLQAVPVQVGRGFGGNVELLGGLQEGDVVAIYDGVTAATKQP